MSSSNDFRPRILSGLPPPPPNRILSSISESKPLASKVYPPPTGQENIPTLDKWNGRPDAVICIVSSQVNFKTTRNNMKLYTFTVSDETHPNGIKSFSYFCNENESLPVGDLCLGRVILIQGAYRGKGMGNEATNQIISPSNADRYYSDLSIFPLNIRESLVSTSFSKSSHAGDILHDNFSIEFNTSGGDKKIEVRRVRGENYYLLEGCRIYRRALELELWWVGAGMGNSANPAEIPPFAPYIPPSTATLGMSNSSVAFPSVSSSTVIGSALPRPIAPVTSSGLKRAFGVPVVAKKSGSSDISTFNKGASPANQSSSSAPPAPLMERSNTDTRDDHALVHGGRCESTSLRGSASSVSTNFSESSGLLSIAAILEKSKQEISRIKPLLESHRDTENMDQDVGSGTGTKRHLSISPLERAIERALRENGLRSTNVDEESFLPMLVGPLFRAKTHASILRFKPWDISHLVVPVSSVRLFSEFLEIPADYLFDEECLRISRTIPFPKLREDEHTFHLGITFFDPIAISLLENSEMNPSIDIQTKHTQIIAENSIAVMASGRVAEAFFGIDPNKLVSSEKSSASYMHIEGFMRSKLDIMKNMLKKHEIEVAAYCTTSGEVRFQLCGASFLSQY